MSRRPAFGLLLAAAAAILLSPDTLMMRLSGLDGFAMLAWRGLLTALALLSAWALTTGSGRRRDLAALASAAGVGVVVAQVFNTTLFSLSISVAPVSVVLFGVATAPVFGAMFAWLILGEPTRRATWITIAAVLCGIALAVFGGPEGDFTLDPWVAVGALGGLGVACALALTFVLLRMRSDLSITLTVGLGSLIGGTFGLAMAGSGVMAGTLWPIAFAGLVLLPVSFFALSYASRHTQAANVSLMLLLETVLGPVFVWFGVGEAPTPAMFLGGAIVVGSLAVYLWHAGRIRAAGRALP